MNKLDAMVLMLRLMFDCTSMYPELEQEFITEAKGQDQLDFEFFKDELTRLNIHENQLTAAVNIYNNLIKEEANVEPTLDDVKMTLVESSNLNKLGYHFDSETLFVEFKNGGVYSYEGVDNLEYEILMNSESKGKAFNIFKAAHKKFKRVK